MRERILIADDDDALRESLELVLAAEGYDVVAARDGTQALALIEAGRRLVVVADHTKWGVIGISSIARLDQVDVLVTDAGLEPDARATLAAEVRELVVVDPAREAVLT